MNLPTSRSAATFGMALVLLAITGSPVSHAAADDPKPSRPAQLWGVVIGIDDQIDPAIPDGKTSAKQASKMLGWLRNVGGWSRDHLLLLTDGGSDDPGLEAIPASNIRPNRKNLEWAFDRWLSSKNVLPNDVILVFYSGRSTRIARNPSPTAPAGSRTLLLPSDAFLKSAETTGWSLDDAMESHARRGAFRIIYWLATNPSELAATDNVAVNPANSLVGSVAGRDWLARLTRWPGVTAWLGADQPATPSATHDVTSSLFSNALIDALNRPGRTNLAAGLRFLQENPRLKLQGFQVAGGVPSTLTVRSDGFGQLAAGGPPRMTLQIGHSGRVNALLASADGRKIFSAGSDATARAWSLDQKALLRVLSGHSVRVSALAMSPEETFLVTGGGRGSVIVHDLSRDFAVKPAGGQPHTADGGLEPSISQIVFLPDSNLFVSIDNQGKSFRWNLQEANLAPKPWLPKVVIRDMATAGDAKSGLAVVLSNDGSIQRFQPDGTFQDELIFGKASTKRSQAVNLALSSDGKRLAIGHEDGQIVVRDLADPKKSSTIALEGVIRKLAFAGTSHLLAGVDSGVVLVRLNEDLSVAGKATLLDEPAAQWAVAPDGLSIAACLANTGALRGWVIAKKDVLETTEVLRDDKAGIYSLAYAGDGSKLVGGGIDVSLKTWDLKGGAKVSAVPTWESPVNSGKIEQTSLSHDRLYLMARAGIGVKLWGLKDRSCRTLPGSWSSGLFVSETTLALTAAADSERSPGRPALVKVSTLEADRGFFADKAEGFELPTNTAFEGLALSADRRLLAAIDSQSPLICVWEVKTGRLLHWTEALDEPAEVLSFSDDGKLLASGGGNAVTSLWKLDPAVPGVLEKPVATFRDPLAQTVTALKIRPKGAGEIVTGHRDGRVLLWKWNGDKADVAAAAKLAKPATLIEGFLDGEVKALAFSDDGADFAAAGDFNSIWLGKFDPKLRRVEGPGARPHHIDQINDLAFWPGLPVLNSAGNDATVRFWDLASKKLWGTLALSGSGGGPDADADADWVLYTPEGVFDASPAGRDRVRYCELDETKPLEQFDNTLYTFRLGDRLRNVQLAKQDNPLDAPIPIAIETPQRDDADSPTVKITVTIGSPKGSGPDDDALLKSIQDIRLYQNGVPIPTGLEDHKGPIPRKFTVEVRLLEKVNRFYAMASRQGAIDSRSPDLEIAYNGKLEGGRVHVVSIGVGDYDRLRLTYASSDAQSISQVLHDRGIDTKGKKGLLRILTNKDVSRETLAKAFSEIARQTKQRPQDTVVVFLAGHTGVFSDERFCLLLPDFPFPKAEPLQIAMRGAMTEVAEGAKLAESHTLPYTAILRNLMRLDALNRLVIVDACQAEAILVDPQVIEINKWMEIGSRRARTSYLLAARKGDPALEFDPLQHGLFTFTLLRGMGAITDDECPEEVVKLGLPTNADSNADGILSTRELRGFVEKAMPRISDLFPKLVAVKRSAVLPKGEAPAPADDSAQFLQLQRASESSFPLIPLK